LSACLAFVLDTNCWLLPRPLDDDPAFEMDFVGWRLVVAQGDGVYLGHLDYGQVVIALDQAITTCGYHAADGTVADLALQGQDLLDLG
jgi:hypothetical protein